MAIRYYSSTAGRMTLQLGITAVATSISVDTTAGLPGATPFTLLIDVGEATEEVVTVTGVSGNTLVVTRGEDGTTAQPHSAGAVVRHAITARDLRDSRDHEQASSGVHGVTSNVVGVSDSQALSNKNLTSATNTFPSTLASTTSLNAHTTATSAHGTSGTIVGTTDTQTLTNKTLNFADNTISNIPQSAVTSLVSDQTTQNNRLSSLESTASSLDNRLDALELDTGWVSFATAGITAATGFTVIDGKARRLFDKIVAIDASLTTTNALSSGDIGNVICLTLPASWGAPEPNGRGMLQGGPNGGGHTAYVGQTSIGIASTTAGYAAGSTLNIVGVYFR